MKYLIIIILLNTHLFAKGIHESSIIDYAHTQAQNPVEDLIQFLRNQKLDHHQDRGYLDAVLTQLNIPKSSQTLVFSKTSFHRKYISPKNPRAIYFNDEIYLGWVPGTSRLEIATTDKNLGMVFYTMEQKNSLSPKIQRNDECLSCHATSKTLYEPGVFIRSVFPDATGDNIGSAGSTLVDHETPINERWGGWFVTSNKKLLHRGNQIFQRGQDYPISYTYYKNLPELNDFFNSDDYPAQTSDITALMVMEHQVQMHNLFTQNDFKIRRALASEQSINKMLKETGRRPFTQKIISSAAEEILEYMLFCNEVRIPDLSTTSQYANDFKQLAPKSRLRNLVMNKRITELSCSWLITSRSFENLNPVLRKEILTRLKQILTAPYLEDKYSHLRKVRHQLNLILQSEVSAY